MTVPKLPKLRTKSGLPQSLPIDDSPQDGLEMPVFSLNDPGPTAESIANAVGLGHLFKSNISSAILRDLRNDSVG